MTVPFSLQVVIDCVTPHELADWWAETLAWEVEPQEEAFIRSMIEQGHATEADTITHRGNLVWASACAVRPPGDDTSARPRLLFQQVPEPKTVKNRIHLDLRTGADVDLAAVHRALAERGAVKVGGGRQGPHTWVTYADPEGNEFCIDS
jgi:hypothetical protein